MEACNVAEPTIGADADRRVARRIARGDAAAIDAFYTRHKDAIYAFAYFRLRRCAEDAEDVTAETFLTAIRSAGAFSGRAPLLVWLRGIARNKCRERARAKARALRVFKPAPADAAALEALARIDREDLPQDVLARAEVAAWVTAVLSQLSPRHQQALRWKYVDALSLVEIGERLQSTPKAAESLVQRAKVAFARIAKAFAGAAAITENLDG